MIRHRINNLIKNHSGFSLVELLIAIVVMAILSLPLLGYFSGALINTSKARILQEGKMAAQSIIEEIYSYSTYEQIDATVASGSALSIDTSEPEVTGFMFLTKNIKVDDKNMIAKISLDFNYDSAGSEMEYNEFEVPKIKSLFTDASVVASENSQLTEAIDEFYIKNDHSYSKGVIRDDIKRKMIVDIAKNVSNNDLLDIKAKYVFVFNGENYTSAPLLKTQLIAADFKRIFLLYNQYREDILTEDIEINMSGFMQEEAEKFEVYIIRQDSDLITKPAGYKLSVSGSGSYANMKYFTNDIPTNISGSETKYIISEKINRIAHVIVDIYKEGETSFTEDTRMLRIESAKGE